MKYDKSQPLAVWFDKVRIFEYGLALQRIAKGDSIEVVMDDMARRIIEKCLHPILNDIRKPTEFTKEQLDESRLKYQQQYTDKIKPAADHVDD